MKTPLAWVPWGDGSRPTLMSELLDADGDAILGHGDGWIEVSSPEAAALIASAPEVAAEHAEMLVVLKRLIGRDNYDEKALLAVEHDASDLVARIEERTNGAAVPDESILLGTVSFLRVSAVIDEHTCPGCRAHHGKVIMAVNELIETICDKAKDGTGECRCTTEPVQPKRAPGFYMDGTT